MPKEILPASGRACGMALFHRLPLSFRYFQITSTSMRCITTATGMTSVSCSASVSSSVAVHAAQNENINNPIFERVEAKPFVLVIVSGSLPGAVHFPE